MSTSINVSKSSRSSSMRQEARGKGQGAGGRRQEAGGRRPQQFWARIKDNKAKLRYKNFISADPAQF